MLLISLFVYTFVLLSFVLRTWKFENEYGIVLTPVSIFLALEVMMWFAPVFLYATGQIGSPYPCFVILFGTNAFLMGYWLAVGVTRRSNLFPVNYSLKSVIPYAEDNRHIFVISLLLLLSLLLGFLYYRGIPPIVNAIVGLLSGKDFASSRRFVSSSREYLTKSHYFEGKYLGQGLIQRLLFVTSFYSLSISMILLLLKKNLKWMVIALIVFLSSFIWVAGTGRRGHFLWGLIVVGIILSYCYRINIRTVLSFFAILFILFLGSTTLLPRYSIRTSRVETLKEIFASAVERIFLGNSVNDVHIIELVRNNTLELRHGQQLLSRTMNALPAVTYARPLAYELFKALNPRKRKTTYLSPTYTGVVYIDFGLPGVIIIYFWIGFVIHVMHLKLLAFPSRLTDVVFLAFVVYYLGEISVSGLVGFISRMVPLLVVHFSVCSCLRLIDVVDRNVPVIAPEKEDNACE